MVKHSQKCFNVYQNYLIN